MRITTQTFWVGLFAGLGYVLLMWGWRSLNQAAVDGWLLVTGVIVGVCGGLGYAWQQARQRRR